LLRARRRNGLRRAPSSGHDRGSLRRRHRD
jgi:hypothetical protein